MLREFRSFLIESNALALAIGVIIGAALGTVVTSLVEDEANAPSASKCRACASTI